MKFRKKPVIIEAIQFISEPSVDEMREAWGSSFITATAFDPDYPEMLHIETLEGNIIARPGDWIIRGVAGEFYPCKAEIFEKTYEPAETVGSNIFG